MNEICYYRVSNSEDDIKKGYMNKEDIRNAQGRRIGPE